MAFDPDTFLSGDSGASTATAPKAHEFDADSFIAGADTPVPRGTIPQEMDWSKTFAGLDYAKNRMGPADRSGFARLAKVTDNSADAQKQVMNMAYVSKILPDVPWEVLQKNWAAARQAFAESALGLKDGEVSDGKLYEAINNRVNANLQQHWATASSVDRLKMMFGAKGYGDHQVEEGQPMIGSEAGGTKGTAFTIPKAQGTDSFSGLIDSVNRVTASLTSPENVALMVGTSGLGEIAALAKVANAAKVALVTKAAQAATVGTFAAQGGQNTVEAYNRAKLVLHDPHATDAAKTEAIADVVLNGAVTAAAAKGTYDIGMDAKADFTAKPTPEGKTEQVPTPEKTAAQEAQQVKTAEMLRDAANEAPKGEVKEVLTEAATKTHPYASNGPQIIETHSGYSVQDAIGNDLGSFRTMEEAQGAVDRANARERARNGTESTPSPAVQQIARDAEVEPMHPTAGIAHRVSEGQGAAAPRGEGINIQEALDEGRKTYTPEKAEAAVAAFEADPAKGVTRETLVQARLHDEALTKAANEAAEKFGENSPEEQAATRAMEDWKARVKPIQTEWAAHGQLQQGETEVDTGTHRGMTKAFRDSTRDATNPDGKEPTPKQAAKITEHVEKVKTWTAEETAAAKEVARRVKEVAKGEVPEQPAKGGTVKRYLDQKISAALERIKARHGEGRVTSGLDPEDLADHAIVGAGYIAKGVATFGEWSKAMVEKFGDYIKPHLQDIFAKAQESAKEVARDAVVSDHKVGEKWTPAEAKALSKRASEMLDQGQSFDDTRHALAKEFNLPVKDVTEGLASPKGMRQVTDEMYAKMRGRRMAQNAAKSWVAEQKYGPVQKLFKNVHQGLFNILTFGHGTFWFSSHAGANLFIPKVTGAMITELGRAFRMMGLHEAGVPKFLGGSGITERMGAYHERMMQDLVRDPLFIKAQRAGLANDPFHYTDDYQNAGVVKMFKELGMIGNRGFDGLKLLRQFRFNQEWASTPKELQTPEMAKIYAEAINKATGHSNLDRIPKGVKGLFFAPALEASKWAMMFKDPVKDLNTLVLDRKNASPEQIRGAETALKTAAAGVATYLSALTLNQAMLSATNSDQKINMMDPNQSDWLDFKGFGIHGSPAKPLLRPISYLFQMAHAFWGERSKFEQSQGSRADEAGTKTLDYARSKLHPFWGVVADSTTGSDFRGNTMPWNDDKIPKYKARSGAHQFTAAEYGATHALPIPMEELMHEVWTQKGIGEAQQEEWMAGLRNALFTLSGTMRVAEDKANHKNPTQPEWMEHMLPSGK